MERILSWTSSWLFLMAIVLYFPVNLRAQLLVNGSFESSNGSFGSPPPGWYSCGGSPDTQVINGNGPGIFAISVPPSHGNTYIGLFSTANQGYQEGIGQPCNLSAGVPYGGSIDVFRSNLHTAWNGHGRIQFWGGSSCNNRTELLWQSNNVSNLHLWTSHSISFTPTQSHSYLIIVVHNMTRNGTYNCFDNLVLGSFLPISLDYLTAVETDGAVDLHWESSTALEGSSFEIGWSQEADAVADFHPLGELVADADQTAFHFHHPQAAAGWNYYRLKMTDVNGHITYSDIQSVHLDGPSRLALHPQPSRGNFEIQAHLSEAGPVKVHIYNLQGQEVYRTTQAAEKGPLTWSLQLEDRLAPGTYSLTFTSPGKPQQTLLTIL